MIWIFESCVDVASLLSLQRANALLASATEQCNADWQVRVERAGSISALESSFNTVLLFYQITIVCFLNIYCSLLMVQNSDFNNKYALKMQLLAMERTGVSYIQGPALV